MNLWKSMIKWCFISMPYPSWLCFLFACFFFFLFSLFLAFLAHIYCGKWSPKCNKSQKTIWIVCHPMKIEPHNIHMPFDYNAIHLSLLILSQSNLYLNPSVISSFFFLLRFICLCDRTGRHSIPRRFKRLCGCYGVF